MRRVFSEGISPATNTVARIQAHVYTAQALWLYLQKIQGLAMRPFVYTRVVCTALCCTMLHDSWTLPGSSASTRYTYLCTQLPLADSALFRAAARQPLDQVAVAELRASWYTVLHHTQGRTICPWRECAGGGTVYIQTYPWPFQCENPRQTARRDKNAWAFISASH